MPDDAPEVPKEESSPQRAVPPLPPPPPSIPLPDVYIIDWSKAIDFRTFVHLWELKHPNDQIIFKPGGFDIQPEKVKKCLVQIPPEEIAKQMAAYQAQQAEAARREAIKKSGLVIPK